MKMRFSKLLVFLILFAALPCAAETLDLSALGDIQDAQMIEVSEPVSEREWTYPISYELLKTSEYIVLANKNNLLDENYIPSDLTKDLDCRKISYDPIQMREIAANALYELFDAAAEDGLYLYAHSGYRSYQTQNTMYYNRLKKNKGVDDGYVAYPGSSDHQTGLGIDVINKAGIGKKFTKAFGETKHGQWLAENCWDYGFIIRYQADKEEITEIEYEPWHLRYVGVQVAQYMRDNHLSLEEFTEEWKEAVAQYEAAGI
ncbi:MAG: M15 family metallopeptidase [Clostridia bacterium]|nr:M15 family metallopeptidase [Clostridia bacterium]MBQ6857834.1 M15 family metallopeptidase [Clostridia bacterium]